MDAIIEQMALRSIRPVLAHLLLALLSPGAGLSQVAISQVYGGGGNTGATLRNDFIELFNRGADAVELGGWSVQYAGAASGSWQVTPLRGTLGPGRYYLVQQAAGAGGTAALPEPDATGTIAMGATAGKVALVRSSAALEGNQPRSEEIADFVGYGTADFAEGSPARAPSNTTALLRRRGGCADTNDNSGDFEAGPPAPRNSASPPNDCSAAAPAAVPLTISAIQGEGAESPFAGRRVETTGIVTARRSNGFYIQSRAADEDSNPETSEGVLVFTQGPPPPEAARGNVVKVTGVVTEFRPAADPQSPPLTELTDAQVELLATGAALPEPAGITASELYPAGGREVLERFEGMRVRVAAVRAVSPTGSTLNEASGGATGNGIYFAVLDGAGRPFREPGNDHPERLRVDTGALDPGLRRDMAGGMEAFDVVGVIDYGFRTYTLLVESGRFPGTVPRPWPPDTVIAPTAGEFAIASMNLRRLFDDRDDPAVADVVLTADNLRRRLDSIAAVIRDSLHSPAVIAVQEAENLGVLEALASRAGPGYRAFLAEGNDPAGIDVGFLVDAGRVAVERVTQEGKTDVYRPPAGGEALVHDRPPLVLTARIGGFSFRAVAVHLRSLINAETPEVQAKRRAQALAVRDLAARLQREFPGDGLAVLGDFNAFPSDEILGTIGEAGLFNLASTLPRDQGFTFIQDGISQTLDHILVNPALRRRWSRYEVGHGNADSPDTAGRYSDHDVPVAVFAENPESREFTAANVTNAATFLTGAVAPGQLVSVFTRTLGQRNFELPTAAAGGRTTVTVGSTSVRAPVATAVPGVFAVVRDGEFADILVNGLAPGPPPAVWVGGRRAEIVERGPFRLRVLAPWGGEVIVVSEGKSSEPGPRLEEPARP